MGDSFGALQVPYLLPKFGFPLLQLRGWVGLGAAELEMKAAPFKIALREDWRQLKRSTPTTERSRLCSEQVELQLHILRHVM